MAKACVAKLIPILCAAILVGLMTAASEYLGEREIIFPEIAAIAVGALVAPKFPWNASKPRILIFICVCAVLGVAVVRFLPLPIWAQMIFAFLSAQLLPVISKTSFAPMISAAVLPVMLQTETPVYLASAAILTALILLCRVWLERLKILDRNEFSPKLPDNILGNLLLRTVLGSALIIPALLFDFRFAAAPPLLVAFTEFSNPGSKVRSSPVRAVALIYLCGFSGAAVRYIFCIRLEVLPLFAASVIVMLIVILLMNAVKLFIPPAGAIAILTLLIPESAVLVYPLQIFVGTVMIMVFSKVFFKQADLQHSR